MDNNSEARLIGVPSCAEIGHLTQLIFVLNGVLKLISDQTYLHILQMWNSAFFKHIFCDTLELKSHRLAMMIDVGALSSSHHTLPHRFEKIDEYFSKEICK